MRIFFLASWLIARHYRDTLPDSIPQQNPLHCEQYHYCYFMKKNLRFWIRISVFKEKKNPWKHHHLLTYWIQKISKKTCRFLQIILLTVLWITYMARKAMPCGKQLTFMREKNLIKKEFIFDFKSWFALMNQLFNVEKELCCYRFLGSLQVTGFSLELFFQA